MKTFKTYLREARAEGSPKQVFEPIDLSEISRYCPDLFWMLKYDTPFYRGMGSGLDVSFVDLTKTKRVSQNTSNWYTEIFDNHPEMKDFPKRSESLICTTDIDYASHFSAYVYAVLPVKNAKIGEVCERDIWAKTIDVFGQEEGIKEMNRRLADIIAIGLETKHCSFELLQKFDRYIKDGDDGDVFQQIQNSDQYSDMVNNGEFVNEFLESILNAYSPHILGLQASTPATFTPYYMGQEVWFDTGAIIIPLNKWREMKKVVADDPSISTWEEFFKRRGLK